MVYCMTDEPLPRGRKKGEYTKMKMKKLFAVIAVLMAMVLVLSACGQKEEGSSGSGSSGSNASAPAAQTIEGTWRLTDMKAAAASQGTGGYTAEELEKEMNEARQQLKDNLVSMVWTFRGGNVTFTQRMAGSLIGASDAEEHSVSGTYTVSGNKVTVNMEVNGATNSVDLTLNGNQLEMEIAGMVAIFTR